MIFEYQDLKSLDNGIILWQIYVVILILYSKHIRFTFKLQ